MNAALRPDDARVCLSGDARCAALAPCLSCYDRFMRYVLPRSMFLAGPTFSSDPHRARHFMRSFSQAWTEARAHAEGGVRQYTEPPAVVDAVSSEPAPPQVAQAAQVVSVESFKAILNENWSRLSATQKEKMRQEVAAGTLDGWSELSEEEKNVLREVVGPPQAAPAKQAAVEAAPTGEPITTKEGRVVEEKQQTAKNGAEEAAPEKG